MQAAQACGTFLHMMHNHPRTESKPSTGSVASPSSHWGMHADLKWLNSLHDRCSAGHQILNYETGLPFLNCSLNGLFGAIVLDLQLRQ